MNFSNWFYSFGILLSFFLNLKILLIWSSIRNINDNIHKINHLKQTSGYKNFDKIYIINKLIKNKTKFNDLPTIYIITPTYARDTQQAELNRLANTLRNVPKIIWILIEDSNIKSHQIKNFLDNSGLTFIHFNIKSKVIELDPLQKLQKLRIHRGSDQRNLAIEYLRNNSNNQNDVIYFADDDNSYMLRLFEQVRTVKKIGIWPVGFVGRLLYEKPICENNKVVDWFLVYNKERLFPTDMASFGINIGYLKKKPLARFHHLSTGNYETLFLKDLTTVQELEPKGDNCRNLMVWHTKSVSNKRKN